VRFAYFVMRCKIFTRRQLPFVSSIRSHSGPNLLATGFYGTCGFVPTWIHEGKVTPDDIAMLEVLRKVSLRGFKESDHIVPSPSFATDDPGSTKSLRASAAFELRVTVAAMRLTTDLHCGRLDPHLACADLLVRCEFFDPVELVWHVF